MGVDVSVVDDVSVGEACEAVVLHNTDSPVRASELLDHAFRDFHSVVDDIVLADRVRAVDGQACIALGACPGGPWTPRVDRPARQVGHGSIWPRSYRGGRLSSRRCMLPWVRTLVGRRCRCWAWRFLSWVVMSRVALRVRLLTAKIREFSEPSCRIGVALRRLGVLAHWNDGTGVKRVFERRLLKLRDSLPAIARYRVPP